ncbi:MAG: DUF2934 domain-containing protein [Thermodesulfovibrio sp.]|nr:DUF2934 domain-containing protein [Thermodesulfovibrio sp.]
MIDKERLEEEIRQVAYEIYLRSGCIPGRDLENWLEAERIVCEKYGLIKEEASSQKQEEKPKRKVSRKSTTKKTKTQKKK